jgi:hypothetical protein
MWKSLRNPKSRGKCDVNMQAKSQSQHVGRIFQEDKSLSMNYLLFCSLLPQLLLIRRIYKSWQKLKKEAKKKDDSSSVDARHKSISPLVHRATN